MGIARFSKALACLALVLSLPGCFAMDKEEEVRAQVASWVFLAQTRTFVSRSTCTVAIFDLISDGVRLQDVRIVDDLPSGLTAIKEGRTVAFEIPGATPNAVSEGLMSIDLAEGMGLLSSFIGPQQACMDDQFQVDVYYALTVPETLTIYDPGSNAMMLLHRPTKILFFMRGNV